MTREEAIAIIRKEYLCVDRDCDIERSCGKCDLVMPSKEPILEAYKMAIKALEQEPKTGHWVEVMEGNAYRYKCTNCDELVVIANGFVYCPHCGAKMQEVKDNG